MKVFYTFSVKLSFCFKNFQLKEKISQIQIINLSNLNKNQWLRHYTCSGFCKTSYHLLVSPLPTNLQNTIKVHTGENNIDRQSRMWRQYTCYFPANGSTIKMFFSLKPSQSQGESSLKISARWGSPFRRSQGTSKHTNSLTH